MSCPRTRNLLLTCAPLALMACAASPGPSQPPISTFLVVHVDPLPRVGEERCADEALGACGLLAADSWVAQTENLRWLVDRWTETGRTLDLQLGPETSSAWAEDPDAVAALVASLQGAGEANPEEKVAETAASGRAAIADALAAGVASLGVHVHEVLPDSQTGVWGAARYSTDGAGPCEAWSGEPMQEVEAGLVERVVAYGAGAADLIAAPLGEPLRSFTGHLPRTMAGKIQVVDGPEDLAPSTTAGFPDSFAPLGLGSAYAECLSIAVDHPPFELYPADEERALGAGDGPLVTPGARVPGSMAEHLGVDQDGSLDAAARRLLQQLYNWRYAALTGAPSRPWVHSFHAHLFDLYPGNPDPRTASARDLSSRNGSPFRGDVEGLAALMDRFAETTSWAGVSGPMVRWSLPAELDGAGSTFEYGEDDAPPPEGLDTDHYPYLPLIAEALADTHLVCAGRIDDVELQGFLRCEAGWAWGADADGVGARGFHCADNTEPTWVYALLSEGSACLPLPGAGRAAGMDEETLGAPPRCADGLAIPAEGLLIEPAAGPWWTETCAPW